MAQASSIPNLSAEQKEWWKDIPSSFADPVGAVELFNSMLGKDFGFLMAFAVLVNEMGANQTIERADSWVQLILDHDEKLASEDVTQQITLQHVQRLLPRLLLTRSWDGKMMRVDFATTIRAVAENNTDIHFMQVFGPFVAEEGLKKPFEMMIYMYNIWILSRVGMTDDLLIEVPQEIKDWVRYQCFTPGSETVATALERLGLLELREIGGKHEFFNRLVAGLCACAFCALSRVKNTRKQLMEQDGENWDPEQTYANFENLRTKRKKRGVFSISKKHTRQLNKQFNNLLATLEEDGTLQETEHVEETKSWAKTQLAGENRDLSDAEWNHIWLMAGVEENSTKIDRGQFILGVTIAEKYCEIASEYENDGKKISNCESTVD